MRLWGGGGQVVGAARNDKLTNTLTDYLMGEHGEALPKQGEQGNSV